MPNDPAAVPYLLCLFTVLLIGRVLGQIVVVLRAPGWLPPMEQWQSGLLPYPALLAGQAVVVALMIWISIDFSRRDGYWFAPHPGLGLVVVWWSAFYAGAMVVRYALRMKWRPDQRWWGGTIRSRRDRGLERGQRLRVIEVVAEVERLRPQRCRGGRCG